MVTGSLRSFVPVGKMQLDIPQLLVSAVGQYIQLAAVVAVQHVVAYIVVVAAAAVVVRILRHTAVVAIAAAPPLVVAGRAVECGNCSSFLPQCFQQYYNHTHSCTCKDWWP